MGISPQPTPWDDSLKPNHSVYKVRSFAFADEDDVFISLAGSPFRVLFDGSTKNSFEDRISECGGFVHSDEKRGKFGLVGFNGKTTCSVKLAPQVS